MAFKLPSSKCLIKFSLGILLFIIILFFNLEEYFYSFLFYLSPESAQEVFKKAFVGSYFLLFFISMGLPGFILFWYYCLDDDTSAQTKKWLLLLVLTFILTLILSGFYSYRVMLKNSAIVSFLTDNPIYKNTVLYFSFITFGIFNAFISIIFSLFWTFILKKASINRPHIPSF